MSRWVQEKCKLLADSHVHVRGDISIHLNLFVCLYLALALCLSLSLSSPCLSLSPGLYILYLSVYQSTVYLHKIQGGARAIDSEAGTKGARKSVCGPLHVVVSCHTYVSYTWFCVCVRICICEYVGCLRINISEHASYLCTIPMWLHRRFTPATNSIAPDNAWERLWSNWCVRGVEN